MAPHGRSESVALTTCRLDGRVGKNLGYDENEIFECRDPEKFKLPKQNISTGYVFAKDKDFFVYPNNYHKFVKYFKDTFQHGGISLEEMVVPLTILDAK